MMNGEATLHPEQPINNFSTAIDSLLNRFAHFGVELGLERIQVLLTALGNPHQQVPILHVAGSNGKGSVCAYLSSVLTQAGYRVGRYTSPHLIDWGERICINEQPIAPSELHSLLLQVLAAIQLDRPSPTQFEVITAAAWLHFAQQQVDIAVIEVGLGGRLDATNVCDRPLVSIITSLSLEHWQRLGPTLADIAREKAGILKPGCPAVLAPLPPETEAVIQQRLADLNCPAIFPQPAFDLGNGWAEWGGELGAENRDRNQSVDHWKARSNNPPSSFLIPQPLKYPLPLLGTHQLTNSALAIATLQLLQQQGWQISQAAIEQGMAKTCWPGRLQWTTWQEKPLLIDGAHNPAGAAALRQYIDTSSEVTSPVKFVIGMLGSKDHGDVLKELLRPGDRLYLVPVPNHIPIDLEALSQLALRICPTLENCQTYADETAGLLAANNAAPALTTVLCGSLYLIGHFFSAHQARR
jgi:dihydrofolate synthase / folylpolyglutamate synthase